MARHKHPQKMGDGVSWPSGGGIQASSGRMLSSIAMSLNSLESKTSPHSWHSTNSASSSRATTRTRGCRQSFFISVVSGGCFAVGEVWIVLIFALRREPENALVTNFGYFYAGMVDCQAILKS